MTKGEIKNTVKNFLKSVYLTETTFKKMSQYVKEFEKELDSIKVSGRLYNFLNIPIKKSIGFFATISNELNPSQSKETKKFPKKWEAYIKQVKEENYSLLKQTYDGFDYFYYKGKELEGVFLDNSSINEYLEFSIKNMSDTVDAITDYILEEKDLDSISSIKRFLSNTFYEIGSDELFSIIMDIGTFILKPTQTFKELNNDISSMVKYINSEELRNSFVEDYNIK